MDILFNVDNPESAFSDIKDEFCIRLARRICHCSINSVNIERTEDKRLVSSSMTVAN